MKKGTKNIALEKIIKSSPDPFITKILLTQLSEYKCSNKNIELSLLNTHPEIAKYLAKERVIIYKPKRIIHLKENYRVAASQAFGPRIDIFNKVHRENIKSISEAYEKQGANMMFYEAINIDKKTCQETTKQIQGIQEIIINHQENPTTSTQEVFEKYKPIIIFGEVKEKRHLSAFVNTRKNTNLWNVTVYNPASQNKFINVEDTKKLLTAYKYTLKKATKQAKT